MPADEKAEWSLINFAKQVAGIPANLRPASDHQDEPPATDVEQSDVPVHRDDDADSASADLPRDDTPVIDEPVIAATKKQLKTADEVAAMILNMLRTIEGYPEHGFTVTVYGSNPWNAMLTANPRAGRVDFPRWAARAREISVQLRNSLDVE